MTIESHPLQPFLPADGEILFLGSFPPPRARWSMEFFYPNFINDFWRIMGLLFFNDKQHFVLQREKRFDRDAIINFAQSRGLGFYDTATRVNRLKDNASDQFLEILEPTDIGLLLSAMPRCRRIVTTGQKASEQLLAQLDNEAADEGNPPIGRLPEIGGCIRCRAFGRDLEFWRMPSTSRAYPLAIEKKAEFYSRLFR